MEFASYEDAVEYLKDNGLTGDIIPTDYGFWVDIDRKRVFANDYEERQAEEFFGKKRLTIDSRDSFTFKMLKDNEITGVFYVVSFPRELLSKKREHTYFKSKKYAERFLKSKTSGVKSVLMVKVDKLYLK